MQLETQEPYVPLEDLAKYLAVSIYTVRSLIKRGVIPKDSYVKIGTMYRFKVSKVEKALYAANAEVEQQKEEADSQLDLPLAITADDDI